VFKTPRQLAHILKYQISDLSSKKIALKRRIDDLYTAHPYSGNFELWWVYGTFMLIAALVVSSTYFSSYSADSTNEVES
jgi:hypothetical protein